MRLAIAGGVPLVRHGLALQLCSRGLPAVDELDDLDQADHDAVILLGLRAEGVTTAAQVAALAGGGTPVLVLTDAPGRWRAGLSGLRAASRGRTQVEVRPLASDLDEVLGWLAEVAPSTAPADSLTDAERDVWVLLAQGLSNAGIAARMSVSPRTVECHVSHVFAKLGLTRDDAGRNPRVAAALHWAAQAG